MATTFFLFPGQPMRATDANGDPVSGAKAYFFQAGTSTPLTVYSDTALSSAHASPIVADANGYFAPAYVAGPDEVKVRVDDADDNTLWTLDYVTGQPVGGLDAESVPFTATARISADDTQEAIEDVDRSVEFLEAGFVPVETTGSSDAYLLNTGISNYTAYSTGDVFLFRVSFQNSGPCTLNVDSVGAVSIKFYTDGSKTNPTSGQIRVGQIVRVSYDGTDFVVTDHWLPLATTAQAQAGTARGAIMDPLLTAAAITALTPSPYSVGSAVATTTGTAVTLLSGQSGLDRIDLYLGGVSTNSTSNFLIQIGDAGGFETSSYASSATSITANTGATNTSGFILSSTLGAALAYYGCVSLQHLGSNQWAMSSNIGAGGTGHSGIGSKTLSGELTQVRITTVSSDTFDAGSIVPVTW